MRQSHVIMKIRCALAFLALASLLAAEPADPFAKTPAKAKADTGSLNVTFLFEAITVPQGTYAAWLDVPADRERLHERAVEAVQAGTAKLDGLHFIRTVPGRRFQLHSTEELLMPTEWDGALESGYQHPTAFQMMPMGDRIEMEAVLGNDGGGTANLAFSRYRFLGYKFVCPDSTPPHVAMAAIRKQEAPCSFRFLPGIPQLVASYSSEGEITLVFVTEQPVPIPSKPWPGKSQKNDIAYTAHVISLDRARAWEMLRQHGTDGEACLARLKTLLDAKEAVREHILTARTLAGTRTANQTGEEFVYGSEFNPPRADLKSPDDKKGQAGHSAFQTRPLGYRVEVEPVASDELAEVQSTLSFERTTHTGSVQDPNWSPNYPVLPLFLAQKVVTSVTQPAGGSVLVSTFSPPGETGINERKDDGRVWLLLLEVQAR